MELARRYAADGATRLHLVDLDGAFDGAPFLELLERIAAAVPPGPGRRRLQVERDVESALAGGRRPGDGRHGCLVLGSRGGGERFGDALVVAIDVRDGRVAVRGAGRRRRTSEPRSPPGCATAGVRRLLVTSTTRDGSSRTGISRSSPRSCPSTAIAAGGVASLDDLALRDPVRGRDRRKRSRWSLHASRGARRARQGCATGSSRPAARRSDDLGGGSAKSESETARSTTAEKRKRKKKQKPHES